MKEKTPGFGKCARMLGPLTVAAALFLGGGNLTAARAQHGPEHKDAVIETTGTVVSARTVDISPRFDGLLAKIHFTPGQFVEKGALLFEFDPAWYQLCLEKDRAKLKRAEAQLRLAEVLLDNKRRLRVHSVSSEMQVKEAEAARDIAAADAAEARSALELAEATVHDMKLYAPISGIISRSYVSEGTFITKMARQQSSLAQIAQQDPVSVVSRVPVATAVPAGQALWSGQPSKEGPEVSLLLPNGSRFPHAGRITGGGYELVPGTQAAEIIFEFPNPLDLLRPGQTVTLQFKANSGGAAIASLSRSAASHCEGQGNSCSH
jgi:membrane fusion protein (multidrug efflux system)